MADFTITIKGIDEVEAKLNNLINVCDQRVSNLVDNMLTDGEHFATNEMGHIDTGRTLVSIKSKRRKGSKTGRIIAGGAAIWIEFGTGVARNSGNTHPMVVDSAVPIYPHGGYGKGHGKFTKGWYYPTDNPRDAIKKDGKYVMTADGKYIAHTKGVPQNMFMYRTYEMLVNNLPQMAQEAFSK